MNYVLYKYNKKYSFECVSDNLNVISKYVNDKYGSIKFKDIINGYNESKGFRSTYISDVKAFLILASEDAIKRDVKVSIKIKLLEEIRNFKIKKILE